MRVLLLPGNNALSHIAKALAVRDELLRRGHEPVMTAAAGRSGFLARLGIEHRVLCDIQEVNNSPSPTFAWFKPRRFLEVVEAERRLIEEVRPDRVLSVFRFTTPLSAALAGVAHDSLACGCMLPGTEAVLGFSPGEDGIDEQHRCLDFFYSYCAGSVGPVVARCGRPPIRDLRELLLGERTMLWDFPEFLPIGPMSGVVHVGPVDWNGWSSIADRPPPDGLEPGFALVSFGTGAIDAAAASRVAGALLDAGHRVVLGHGGQAQLRGVCEGHPRLTRFEFAPMGALFAGAAVLVCHGGQQTVFEGLRGGVPVVVVPQQPEQAHNGVCLERLKVGGRLIPPTWSSGGARNYLDALFAMTPVRVEERVMELARAPGLESRLRAIAKVIDRLGGARAVVDLMEAA